MELASWGSPSYSGHLFLQERYCLALGEEELAELRLFCAQRRREALGQGVARLVPLKLEESTCENVCNTQPGYHIPLPPLFALSLLQKGMALGTPERKRGLGIDSLATFRKKGNPNVGVLGGACSGGGFAGGVGRTVRLGLGWKSLEGGIHSL